MILDCVYDIWVWIFLDVTGECWCFWNWLITVPTSGLFSAFCEWQVQCQVRLFSYFHAPFRVWSEVRRYGCCILLCKPYSSPNLTGYEWTLFLCWIRQRIGALIFSSVFSSGISLLQRLSVPADLLLWFFWKTVGFLLIRTCNRTKRIHCGVCVCVWKEALLDCLILWSG